VKNGRREPLPEVGAVVLPGAGRLATLEAAVADLRENGKMKGYPKFGERTGGADLRLSGVDDLMPDPHDKEGS
jgi:hypothetical protein